MKLKDVRNSSNEITDTEENVNDQVVTTIYVKGGFACTRFMASV